jgi:RsiW-degrading membrane proteinase PrsW (M82 family)
VPEGAFCGACGAHLSSPTGASAWRHHAYAANPSQHVLHPSMVTTLFPHLPHRHRLPFQIALGVTAALVVILGLLRWTGPLIAVAALAIPLVYLLYLYEVEVYEDEPVLVIGATLVLGVVLGAAWAHFIGPVVTRLLLQNSLYGLSVSRALLGAVVLPLAAQVLMLAGALVLFARRRYDEALDGFTFGAAGALGFTMASTLVNLYPELGDGLVAGATARDSLLDALQRGLCVPIINASLTGLIGGALWLQRGPIRRLPYHRAVVGLGTVLAVTVALRVGLGLVSVALVDPLWSFLAYGAVAIASLLWVRIALHYMLLTEAVEVAIGPASACSHCRQVVPRMAFCPQCGIATRATPKTGSGRAHRAVRAGTVSQAGVAEAGRAAAHKTGRAAPWALFGAIVVVTTAVLAVVAQEVMPHALAACSIRCAPAPPPRPPAAHIAAGVPQPGLHRYTAPTYGYSLDYTNDVGAPLPVSGTHAVGWQASDGSFLIMVQGEAAHGRTPRQLAAALQRSDLSGARALFAIAGAELGYTAGYGQVYDMTLSPQGGQREHVRALIEVAVRGGTAVELLAVSAFTPDQSTQPAPAQLDPWVQYQVDNLGNTITWKGEPQL